MGDRCWANVTLRESDSRFFEELGFVEDPVGLPNEGPAGTLTLVHCEANYGNEDGLFGLKGKGVPFLAYHSEGESYPCALLASDGQEVIAIPASRNSKPVVEVDEQGIPDQEQLHNVREYRRIEAKARAMFGKPAE